MGIIIIKVGKSWLYIWYAAKPFLYMCMYMKFWPVEMTAYVHVYATYDARNTNNYVATN